MLNIKQCYISNDVIYQTMLYIKRCYISNDVIYQTMLYIKRCYISNDEFRSQNFCIVNLRIKH